MKIINQTKHSSRFSILLVPAAERAASWIIAVWMAVGLIVSAYLIVFKS